MQKAVYTYRQWVIFLFINEWTDLEKGSFVDYNHNVTWQLPHWKDSPLTDSQGSARQGFNLMVVLICSLNFYYLKIPALWTYKIYFVSGKCLLSILDVLGFPSSLSSFTAAQQSHSLPSHRTFLIFGLWVRPLPIWKPWQVFSANNCVSLGTILKSALLRQEAFLASLYSDHSITQVGLVFGHSVPSIPLFWSWSVIILEVEFWLYCVVVLICESFLLASKEFPLLFHSNKIIHRQALFILRKWRAVYYWGKGVSFRIRKLGFKPLLYYLLLI